jgi:hypothetical protein
MSLPAKTAGELKAIFLAKVQRMIPSASITDIQIVRTRSLGWPTWYVLNPRGGDPRNAKVSAAIETVLVEMQAMFDLDGEGA